MTSDETALPPRRRIDDLPQLVAELVERLDERPRLVLGIAGPPGSGKSHVASEVVALCPPSIGVVVAPMDGFHRSNEDLAAHGLLALKGVPESFDAAGFIAHLRRLRVDPPIDVPWPTFDRSREQVVPEGRLVAATDRLVVVEGNYLLLDTDPWGEVRPLLDVVWYLDAPPSVLVPRLVARHRQARSPADAAQKVASTDLPNASLVAATRPLADLVIDVAPVPPRS